MCAYHNLCCRLRRGGSPTKAAELCDVLRCWLRHMSIDSFCDGRSVQGSPTATPRFEQVFQLATRPNSAITSSCVVVPSILSLAEAQTFSEYLLHTSCMLLPTTLPLERSGPSRAVVWHVCHGEGKVKPRIILTSGAFSRISCVSVGM